MVIGYFIFRMTGRALSVTCGVNPKFGLIRIDIKHLQIVSM